MTNSELIVHLQSKIAKLKDKEEKYDNRILELQRKNETDTKEYSNLEWNSGRYYGRYSELEEVIYLLKMSNNE